MINEVQSAFIPRRLITDNMVVAFETMHSIAKRKKGKDGLMAINLDISKAYDRVEWAYLGSIMRKMGFGERWISLIMMCVTAVSYSILISREPRGNYPIQGAALKGPYIPVFVPAVCRGVVSDDQEKGSRGDDKGGVSE